MAFQHLKKHYTVKHFGDMGRDGYVKNNYLQHLQTCQVEDYIQKEESFQNTNQENASEEKNALAEYAHGKLRISLSKLGRN